MGVELRVLGMPMDAQDVAGGGQLVAVEALPAATFKEGWD